MEKTGGQIEYDIYLLLKDELKSFIKGEVYLKGTRPENSQAEDAVIGFKTGVNADVQTGKVTVNIYVPDVYVEGYASKIKDIARCTEIERQAFVILDKPQSEYQFSLGMTIATVPEPEINQHFINIDLKYKRFTFN